MNASQFYFTLDSDLDSLDEKHTIFGEVNACPLSDAPAAVTLEQNLTCSQGFCSRKTVLPCRIMTGMHDTLAYKPLPRLYMQLTAHN